ncbi:shikimate dehydrogenase [Arthrobacter sp. Hiyo8]|nr:shikimate dehydrogenase [Arthrobacter sp. Hiyo8]
MSNRAESFLVGLIGEGVSPSLTPPMHEREADVQGLRYLYRPIDLLELSLPGSAVGDLLTAASRLGYNGLNITHPCKQLVLPFLDEVSEDARRLGAVNTVLIKDGRFTGHNTDFSGFGSALASGLPDAGLERVVQLGAGVRAPPSHTPSFPRGQVTGPCGRRSGALRGTGGGTCRAVPGQHRHGAHDGGAAATHAAGRRFGALHPGGHGRASRPPAGHVPRGTPPLGG